MIRKGFYYDVDYGKEFYWGKVLMVFSGDVGEDASKVEMSSLH